MLLKAELFMAMNAEVQLAEDAAKKSVLRTTVEKSIRDIFLNGYELSEKRVQNTSYQFIKYFLKNLVAVGTMDPILALDGDKRSQSGAFMDAVSHHIAENPKFQKPVMVKELTCTADTARSVRPSSSSDRRRLMWKLLTTALDSWSGSADEEGTVRRSRLMTDNKKGRLGRSRRRKGPEGTNGSRRKNGHGIL